MHSRRSDLAHTARETEQQIKKNAALFKLWPHQYSTFCLSDQVVTSLGFSACSSSLNVSVSASFLNVWRRSEEHTSELQSRGHLVCRLLLEKKNNINLCTSAPHL